MGLGVGVGVGFVGGDGGKEWIEGSRLKPK